LPPPPPPQLDTLIARETVAAKFALAAADRPSALAALRRRRLHETSAEALDANLITIESVLTHVEDAGRQVAVVGALKAGSAALAALRARLPLADVEAVLADTAAAAAYDRQLTALLGAGALTAGDEAAVEGELAALEAAAGAAVAAQLPAAPTHAVKADVAVAPAAEAEAGEERVAVEAD